MHSRIDDLPVFSDDEETARRETNVHDWTPHQSKDISSRIAELRKGLTLSMEKSSDLRSLKASEEKSERERTSIDSAKKDQIQTVKTTLNYGDDSLSLKPYLSKNRDDNYLENEKGKMRIPGSGIPGKVNVVIEKNKKIPETNPSCPHEEKKQMIRDIITSRVEKKENDTYEEEYLNTDENRMIGILTRLQEEDKILQEETRHAAEEEAQRRERLFLIQRKVAEKERERRQTQKLMLMQEEREKLERSLQSKIQERIATDQRLRALIEEEIRLTSVLSSHVNEENLMNTIETSQTETPLDIKTERDLQYREMIPRQIEEKAKYLFPDREITETEVILNTRARELDMKETYLRRLEYEIQSKTASIRENLELRADETSRETQSATKQRSGTEATKGELRIS